MYVNLILGLRDIWKHKVFFGACIAFLVVFNVVVMMIAVEIYIDNVSEMLIESRRIVSFDPVYTQFNFLYDRNNLDSIFWIYEENAVTTRQSTSLTESYARPVYLVFGDGSLINSDILNQEGITVYAYDIADDLNYIDILGVNHEVKSISYSERFQDASGNDIFQFENSIFVVYQGEAMIDLIHSVAENSPNFFYELIGNTWIMADDSKRIDDFREYIANHVEGLSFKDKFYEAGGFNGSGFISYYLLPLTVILALTGILSFLLIFQSMLQRMKRDLTIHIQSGALFRDVLLRFYVFYGALIGISVVILYVLGVINFISLPIIFGIYLILAVSVMVYVARALNKTNLFDNLRGDMI